MLEAIHRWCRYKDKEQILLIFVVLFSPTVFILNNTLDYDIWFLLNHGRYVFEHGIPSVEPFTMHAGFSFVMQQWLSASIFWAIYSVAGFFGLKILTAAVVAMICFLVFLLCMRVSKNNFFISLILAVAASLMLILFATARPGLFSTSLLALQLLCLEIYIEKKQSIYLLMLPIISAFMINLHAAMWPVIFVLLLPYIAENVLITIKNGSASPIENRKLALTSLGMFLGGFANPYGWTAMTYLFRSFGYPEISGLVGEMYSPQLFNPFGIALFGSLIMIVLMYLIPRDGAIPMRFLLLTIGTVYMALYSIRNIPIFAIGGLFPVACYLRNQQLPMRTQMATPFSTGLRKALAFSILLLLISSIGLSFHAQDIVNRDVLNLRHALFKVKAIQYDCDVVLYTGQMEGNMAEFYGLRPYIDTRSEVFLKANNHKEDIMKEYYNLQKGHLHCKRFLEKYNFTHIVISDTDILFQYLKNSKDYKIIYFNKEYYVYEKNT